MSQNNDQSSQASWYQTQERNYDYREPSSSSSSQSTSYGGSQTSSSQSSQTDSQKDDKLLIDALNKFENSK